MTERSGSGRRMSRRQALGLLGLGAATVAVGATGWATSGAAGPTRSGIAPPSGETLQVPAELASRQGRLGLDLSAAPGAPLAGRDASAWGYNGSSPGPTLRVRPGDQLALRLHNRLDQPTNLHTHGLRVSPEGNSDNPFLHIAPGESFDYRITVPSEHPPGTFWYHPHAHGHVADQLSAGLAGALIVDDGSEPSVTTDRVLVVTDATLGTGGPVPADGRSRMAGRQGELLLLNGQHQPTIPCATGDVERWRLINATTSRTLTLRLDAHPLTRIALDGITLPTAVRSDTVRLAPGNRTDVLVRPDRPGTFALIATTEARSAMGMGMGPGGAAVDAETTTVATLAPSGPPRPPSALPTFPAGEGPTRDATTGTRRLAFSMGMGPGGMGPGGMNPGGMGPGGQGMTFGFDGRAYDADRTDQTVALGAVEEWTVTNPTPMAHPFHLHVWPFEVLADSARTPTTATLQDVVLVPAQGWVRLRIPFTAQTGRSVYHCHVLDHEDLGMMATIAVN
ncbi:multicopper oxidase family protein [Actinomycetospora cinnamomea]|uniref:FtsP/CotA-like multicopper oxidase with cupredoxin domain n=1 Tax=Actinomycetospora cinnamomea TaxID=663609 RepID=A0A2U1FRQ2_9PSEU|nr:multicopper oxidase family protein [Actinomycetospora cinnamomea]PVZ14792.1 FtsP/CotA-like multicopper oxidase with cupredoxin domain [Actinomycetospora cinnamomea]